MEEQPKISSKISEKKELEVKDINLEEKGKEVKDNNLKDKELEVIEDNIKEKVEELEVKDDTFDLINASLQNTIDYENKDSEDEVLQEQGDVIEDNSEGIILEEGNEPISSRELASNIFPKFSNLERYISLDPSKEKEKVDKKKDRESINRGLSPVFDRLEEQSKIQVTEGSEIQLNENEDTSLSQKLQGVMDSIDNVNCKSIEELSEALTVEPNIIRALQDLGKINLIDGIFKVVRHKKKVIYPDEHTFALIEQNPSTNFRELSEKIHIPKATLYNWYYKSKLIKEDGIIKPNVKFENKNENRAIPKETKKKSDNTTQRIKETDKVKVKIPVNVIKRDMLEIYLKIEFTPCDTFLQICKVTGIPLGTIYDWYSRGRIHKVDGIYKPNLNLEHLKKDLKGDQNIFIILGIIKKSALTSLEEVSEVTNVPIPVLEDWIESGNLYEEEGIFKPKVRELEKEQASIVRPKRDVNEAFANFGNKKCSTLEELSEIVQVPKKTLYNWYRQGKLDKVDGFFRVNETFEPAEETNFNKLKERAKQVFEEFDTSGCETFADLSDKVKVSKTALHSWYTKGLIIKKDDKFIFNNEANLLNYKNKKEKEEEEEESIRNIKKIKEEQIESSQITMDHISVIKQFQLEHQNLYDESSTMLLQSEEGMDETENHINNIEPINNVEENILNKINQTQNDNENQNDQNI